ncbi:hypothetical protein SCOR_29310 [Sulfidibacter corallicola]|uniref:Uncharacterized protein n=1 Tax=Sulfidibacter corallicola TaxID=2818388 RepID=A0A8A4TUZ3_SULCO|nr:hypothetical protein [Sulfidibacter corallicola]QTD50345.1 hypothetical protein J3U87_32575 [Sulfidibacter corallicola]
MPRDSSGPVGSSGAVSPPDELVEAIRASQVRDLKERCTAHCGNIEAFGFGMCDQRSHLPGTTTLSGSREQHAGSLRVVSFSKSSWDCPLVRGSLEKNGAFNLSWVLPTSNFDQECRNDGNQEKQDHDVTQNAEPILVSDVHEFLLNFSDERPMTLREKPGGLFLSRNRAGYARWFAALMQ